MRSCSSACAYVSSMRSYEIGRHDGRTEWSSNHQDSLTYALRKQGLNMDGDEKVSNTQRMNRSMCLVLNQNNAATPQMKFPHVYFLSPDVTAKLEALLLDTTQKRV